MPARHLSVYRIVSVYSVTGSLVTAETIEEAVKLWCEGTDSRESAIKNVECLGPTYTAR